MSRTNQILGGVAAVQLALVALTWWPEAERTHEPRTLVELPGEVDRFVVHGRVQPGATDPVVSIELKKQDGRWVIPSAYDYPADATKIAEVLDHLTGLQVRAPTATRASSHTSLNVADADHARTVELYSGDASVSMVLGAASGTAAHIRLADEDEAFTVRGWTAWSVGELPRSYWETSVVELEPETVDSVTLTRPDGGFTLKRTAEGWTEAGESELLDPSEVEALLTRLANLKIADVLGTEVPAVLEGGTRVEWTAVVDDKTVQGGIVFSDKVDDNAVARVDGSRWTVSVPDGTISRWRTLTLDELADVDDLDEMPDLPPNPHSPH